MHPIHIVIRITFKSSKLILIIGPDSDRIGSILTNENERGFAVTRSITLFYLPPGYFCKSAFN